MKPIQALLPPASLRFAIAAALALLAMAPSETPDKTKAETPVAANPAPDTAAPDTAAPAPLAITAIALQPAKPAAGSLSKLRVTIANRGTRPVSGLRFRVEIAGTPLVVYERQLFIETLDPEGEHEVRLFNFWTSEPGRPLAAGDTLRLGVTLEAARFLSRDVSPEGDEILSLEEAVPGLPVKRELSIKLRR